MTPAFAPALETTEPIPGRTGHLPKVLSAAPQRSPFNRVVLPDDHCTVAGERFYTLRKIADHIGMSTHNLNHLCNQGKIQFIIKPLTRNGQAGTGTKLVPEAEVRRLLSEGI